MWLATAVFVVLALKGATSAAAVVDENGGDGSGEILWCSMGLKNGSLCCDASCVVCGGPACSGTCCGGHLHQQGRTCTNEFETQCLIPKGVSTYVVPSTPASELLASTPAAASTPPLQAAELDYQEVPWCSQGKMDRSGKVCCASDCPVCGGPICKELCCGGAVSKLRRSCKDGFQVSCLVPRMSGSGDRSCWKDVTIQHEQNCCGGFAPHESCWNEYFTPERCCRRTALFSIITGTGRAGTSFLVGLLWRLGMPTGFATENMLAVALHPNHAGLEKFPGKAVGNVEIFKSPRMANEDEWQEAFADPRINDVIVPVRNITAVAKSVLRAREFDANLGGFHDWSKDVEGLRRSNEKLLANLVVFAVLRSLKITLLAFPRFLKDGGYAYDSLSWLCERYGVEKNTFLRVHQAMWNPSWVHY